jgi:dGTP triphosphohydrolase
MHAWSQDKDDHKRLPQPLLAWQAMARDESRDPLRCLIDFVAGLSDHQALGLHRALHGKGAGLVNSLVI